MTFPGMVPVTVSGQEGEGAQEGNALQARDQEVPFEALSMRHTEVGLIAPCAWVGEERDRLLPFRQPARVFCPDGRGGSVATSRCLSVALLHVPVGP